MTDRVREAPAGKSRKGRQGHLVTRKRTGCGEEELRRLARTDAARLREIQRELDRATERRTKLWEELSRACDSEKSVEIHRLSNRIEALRTEERETRARLRNGPRERILARALAESRIDRELVRGARDRRRAHL